MKSSLNWNSARQPFPVCPSAYDPILPPQNDPSTKRAERRLSALLSIFSATISLSSSLSTGPLITLSAGWSRNHIIRGSWLPSCRQVMGTLSFIRTDPDTIPPIQQVTVIFHIFCLSSLVLYRSRKTDPYQTAIIILVTLLGISLDLFLVFRGPYMDIVGTVISILPCLLSLGAILSAGLHTIWPSLCTEGSGLSEDARFEPDIEILKRTPWNHLVV